MELGRPIRLLVTLVAVVALLGAAPALAAPAPADPSGWSVAAWLDLLWGRVAGMLDAWTPGFEATSGTPGRISGANGAHVDPDGAPADAEGSTDSTEGSPDVTTYNSPRVDPNG